MMTQFSRLSPTQRWIAIGFALLVLVVGILIFTKPKPVTGNPQVEPSSSATSSTEPVVVTNAQLVSSTAPVEGPFAAKVTIVEFLDFQCPGCAGYHPVLQQMRTEFKDRIKFVVRHFPLVEIHPYAKGAAIASVCAQRQDKFFEYADVLFANQNYLRRQDLEQYAEELKLDMGAFKTCLDDPEAAAQVVKDREEGEKLGVKFTPSIYINGKLLGELIPPEDLRNVIARELMRAGQ